MSIPIPFEALHNARDLGETPVAGGRKVRSGLLFRSDQPHGATDSDKEKLRSLGLRVMVDFRSLAEHEDKPDPRIEGVRNVHIPVIEDVRAGITHGEREAAGIGEMLMSGAAADPTFVDRYMQNMYRQFVNDAFSNAQYARFVDEVAGSVATGGGVLWHCTAGKDRAGFATVILLHALGAARETIVEDYLQTNESLSSFIAGLYAKMSDKLQAEGAKEAFMRFMRADASYLNAAFDEAERVYGSFDAYLEKAIRIDAAKRERLRYLLTE